MPLRNIKMAPYHIEQLNIFQSHFLSFDVKAKLQMFNGQLRCFPAENSKLYTRFAIYQCYRSNIKWILSKPRSGIFDGRKTKTLQTSVIYVSSTHSHANNVLPLTHRSN